MYEISDFAIHFRPTVYIPVCIINYEINVNYIYAYNNKLLLLLSSLLLLHTGNENANNRCKKYIIVLQYKCTI